MAAAAVVSLQRRSDQENPCESPSKLATSCSPSSTVSKRSNSSWNTWTPHSCWPKSGSRFRRATRTAAHEGGRKPSCRSTEAPQRSHSTPLQPAASSTCVLMFNPASTVTVPGFVGEERQSLLDSRAPSIRRWVPYLGTIKRSLQNADPPSQRHHNSKFVTSYKPSSFSSRHSKASISKTVVRRIVRSKFCRFACFSKNVRTYLREHVGRIPRSHHRRENCHVFVIVPSHDTRLQHTDVTSPEKIGFARRYIGRLVTTRGDPEPHQTAHAPLRYSERAPSSC